MVAARPLSPGSFNTTVWSLPQPICAIGFWVSIVTVPYRPTWLRVFKAIFRSLGHSRDGMQRFASGTNSP